MSRGRTGRLAHLITARRTWFAVAVLGVTVGATFASAYQLPGLWKGIAPAAVPLVAGLWALYDGRRREPGAVDVSTAKIEKGREHLLGRIQAKWVPRLTATPGLRGVSLGYRLQQVSLAPEERFPRQGNPALVDVPVAWTEIEPAFTRAGRHLLLLGPGGAGKTWVLISLAARLHDLALRDPSARIPVVLPLAGWTRKESGSSLGDWVIREMKRLYNVPDDVSRHWLNEAQLMLLLDGLDEVEEARMGECVEDINKLLESYGLNGVLITSRDTRENAHIAKLAIDDAVALAPLSLDEALASGSLSELASQLGKDDLEEWARELLNTPLMLSIAAVALSPDSTGELRAAPAAERASLLFDAYLARVIGESRRLGLAGHSGDRFMQYLTSFARLLATLRLTEFGWRALTSAALPASSRRLVTIGFPLAAGASVGGLTSLWVSPWQAAIFGFGTALLLIPDAPLPWITGSWEKVPVNNRDSVVAACALVLAVGGGVALSRFGGVITLIVVLVVLAFVPFVNFCAAGVSMGIAGVFSARLIGGVGGVALGGAVIILCGILLGSLAMTVVSAGMGANLSPRQGDEPQFSIWTGAAAGALFGMIIGFVIAAVIGILGAIALAFRFPPIAVVPVAAGAVFYFLWLMFRRSAPDPDATTTRQLLGVLAPLGGMVTLAFTRNWWTAPLAGLVGLTLYLVCYLWREHDGIPRLKRPVIHALLAFHGDLPWRFRPFADAAVDRMLLRHVDGGYAFWHPLLEQHIYQKSIH